MFASKRSIISLSFAFALVIPPVVRAAPVTIQVVQATYNGSLSATVRDLRTDPVTETTQSRALLGSSEVSDDLYLQASQSFAAASADAKLFSTEANTSSGQGFGRHAFSAAEIRALIDFQPLVDTNASVGIDMLGLYQSEFSEGLVSLVDLTLNELLWEYVWDELPENSTVPWVRVGGNRTASWATDTPFLASHQYQLEMFTSTHSNKDAQRITVNVSGLHVVPEPASALLFGASLGALLALRRSRAS